MFIRHKKNRSGTTSIVIVDKDPSYKEIHTVGVASNEEEINELVLQGQRWINNYTGQAELDFDDTKLTEEQTLQFLNNIENVLINGTQLILDRVIERIGFDQIKDDVLRHLVISRLTFPSSKAATSDYLRMYFDEDVNLNKIYRYLDKFHSTEKERVQEISVKHTREILGGTIGVVFYDVTTLYFETDNEDDLRKTGFSKDGKHSHPQIVLGLLVSMGGYPLAYSIHEGNKYEGHTMLPIVEEFVKKYDLEDFVVVADSGLLNKANITELEKLGYKYIIGARIKNESEAIKKKILKHPRIDGTFTTFSRGKSKQKLIVGYSKTRAKKDAYNREKGLRRLEKIYKNGMLTKDHVNNRGYNKYVIMTGGVKVEIDYEKIEAGRVWDGLKGYITNTNLAEQQVYEAYAQLSMIENSFRIAKSKLDIRPIFHFTRKRIEAHICICFIALKVHKELERLLKMAQMPISADKAIQLSKTVTTIVVNIPQTRQKITKTMIMKRHKLIEPLFEDGFWVAQ